MNQRRLLKQSAARPIIVTVSAQESNLTLGAFSI